MEGNLVCGCMVDGEAIPCVFDDPHYTVADCKYAEPLHKAGRGKEDCEYWKPLADEEHANSLLTAEITQLTAERDRYKVALENILEVVGLDADQLECICDIAREALDAE